MLEASDQGNISRIVAYLGLNFQSPQGIFDVGSMQKLCTLGAKKDFQGGIERNWVKFPNIAYRFTEEIEQRGGNHLKRGWELGVKGLVAGTLVESSNPLPSPSPSPPLRSPYPPPLQAHKKYCSWIYILANSHTGESKTSISHSITLMDQFLTPYWEEWVVADISDERLENM